jgi:hypothetical protein
MYFQSFTLFEKDALPRNSALARLVDTAMPALA